MVSEATTYHRAAGYFSSSVFSIAYDEFTNFFARGGRYELVTSPEWSFDDVAAMYDGVLKAHLYTGADPLAARPADARSGARWLLSWGIANGRIHVRIASPTLSDAHAIFHEKFGVLHLNDGRSLAFEGSANESRGGFVSNFERLRVLGDSAGALNPADSADSLFHEFDRLWSNDTAGLYVTDFFSAARSGLIRTRTAELPGERAYSAMTYSSSATPSGSIPDVPEAFALPPRLQLRDYQRDAIRAWFTNRGRGTLAMATGTGKTITALSLAHTLYAKVGPPLAVIFVAPLLHLVDQWEREAMQFGLRPVKCTGAAGDWESLLRASIYALNSDARPVMSVVVTLATFCTDRFQRLLELIRTRTLLVVDEVHNAGSAAAFRAMPERVALRVGLSATPERWMDDSGTDRIARYFGGTVFEFGIRDALHYDPPILTPYFYHPVLIHLDEDEAEEYSSLTAAIGRSLATSDVDEMGDVTLRLLVRRSRLIASARNKLPTLKRLMQPFSGTSHSLVYCGDGQVDPLRTRDSALEVDSAVARQIDAAALLLGRDLGMRVNTYTAETPLDEREQLRTAFESGQLQALVAIRCLDEGLDIPSIRRAFILASSTNPKQFIQRRGRILRRASGKERADIYDFIVVPPPLAPELGAADSRGMARLLEREFRRVLEFARDAVNRAEAELALMPILEEWDLLHL